MEEFRSKSYGDGGMELENNNYYCYYRNGGDMRCYSASYATSAAATHQNHRPHQPPRELRKAKSGSGSVPSKASWCFSDPEMQRKKRVASYKAYTVEGKIKRTFSKSFRWLKDKYTHMVHGW